MMAKSNKKKGYDAVKALAVKTTASQFGCTEAYVRMCITGTAKNGSSEDIKKYFQKKYNELTATLKN